MYCNYPLTETVRVLCYYMLQESDGVAKLLGSFSNDDANGKENVT